MPLPAGSNGNGTSSATAGINPQLVEVLQNVANGVLTAGDGAVQLSALVGQSRLSSADAAMVTKAEFPEVVWGEHKSAAQVLASLQRIAERQGMAAATRVGSRVAAEVCALDAAVSYVEPARMLVLKSDTTKQQKLPGSVALICAGTADVGVVEECRVMLAAAGCYAFKLAESGVMGMHRIVQNLDAVKAADVVICITGMDGGLASVVAGLLEVPVIALPTSTGARLRCVCLCVCWCVGVVRRGAGEGKMGEAALAAPGLPLLMSACSPRSRPCRSAGYGAAFSGVAPMLAALNSSAPGVCVVNIDSGFGASMAAWRILKNAARIRQALTKA